MKFRALLILFFCLHVEATSSFVDERIFLKKLGDFEKRRANDDPLPYLVVSSAQAYKLNKDIVYKITKTLLHANKRDPKSLEKKENLQVPEISISGSELDGIQQCNRSYCAVKLLNSTEKNRLEMGSDKKSLFQQFLFERITAYLKLGELRGSEDIVSNLDTIRSGFSKPEFMKKLYPLSYGIITETVLKQQRANKAKPFVESVLSLETIHLQADKVKPVLRFSEIFEFEENGTNLFVDLHVYSNHFFDSSLRIVEVQGHGYPDMPSRVIITDVMEVDELKKSGLIRALFKGKMINGIEFYQDTLLDKIKSEVEILK